MDLLKVIKAYREHGNLEAYKYLMAYLVPEALHSVEERMFTGNIEEAYQIALKAVQKAVTDFPLDGEVDVESYVKDVVSSEVSKYAVKENLLDKTDFSDKELAGFLKCVTERHIRLKNGEEEFVYYYTDEAIKVFDEIDKILDEPMMIAGLDDSYNAIRNIMDLCSVDERFAYEYLTYCTLRRNQLLTGVPMNARRFVASIEIAV